jgi:O-antigen ligase
LTAQAFSLAISAVLLVLLGSAAHTLAPGFAYALILVGAFAVVANPAFQKSVFDYVPPERLAGVLVFNAFFLLATFRTELDLRTRLICLISLGTFLLSFAAAQLALQGTSASHEKAKRVLGLAAFTTLILLLCGQLAEIVGYIAPQDPGLTGELSFWQRPGGFMNSNMTAAVGLALIYIAFELGSRTARVLSAASLTVFCISLVLTQSRAGMLFGGLYLLSMLFRKTLSYWLVLCLVTLFSLVATAYLEEPLFQIVMDNFVSRFERDSSFNERVSILVRAVDLVGDSPLWGHGYRHVQHVMSVSTHNEILENAVNFGILGSAIVWISFVLMYQPRSVSFLVTCIAPSLLFSHNFFETVSLQVTLGVACVVATMRRAERASVSASNLQAMPRAPGAFRSSDLIARDAGST